MKSNGIVLLIAGSFLCCANDRKNGVLPLGLPDASRQPLDRPFFCVEPVALPVADWFDDVHSLGVGTVGVKQVNWDTFEPVPPTEGVPSYTAQAWERLDEVVQLADRDGLRLQLTVQVRSPWGTVSTDSGVGAPGSSPVAPGAEAHFARWMEDLLLATAPVGAGTVVMMGNELEAPGHWTGSESVPADGDAVTEMLGRTAEVRDNVAPLVDIWRGSTNFGPIFDDGPDDGEVETRLAELLTGPDAVSVLESGLRGDGPFDAFSIHPNFGATGLYHQVSWLRRQLPSGTPVVAEDMRSTLVNGIEVHWADADGDGEPDILSSVAAGEAGAVATFQAAQVEVLSQKLLLAASSGLDTACVSTLWDFPVDYPIAAWRYTGLIDDAGQRRPAYESYRLWIDLLTGWTPHEPLETGETGRYVVPFSRGNQLAAAVWGTGQWEPPSAWGTVDTALRPPTAAGETEWAELERAQALQLQSTPTWVALSSP